MTALHTSASRAETQRRALIGDDLTAQYAKHPVFSGVSIRLEPAAIHAIIGPNGAGKTTLLATLAALHRGASGTVTIGEERVASRTARERAHIRALVPQGHDRHSGFTVQELVELGRFAHRRPYSSLDTDDRRAVDAALAQTRLSPLADRPLDTLSGGQRQLAFIAKALAQRSEYLLLDEPLSALDPRHQLDVMTTLQGCASEGIGIAVVLHDLTLAARMSDTLTVVAGGRIYASGSPAEVLTPEMLSDVYGVRAAVRIDPDTKTPAVTLLDAIPS
ncbi:ABC transporter ATP-binding protein [Paramicrobacterium chengjingii]|uniref:ABC transporter ATP-binding protein n=1 Tax=Paramicrobacterium chengjingii TaxID=2769067 RepID=A0ABX6YFW9_9MICO|nr:ABC transporter ATP-binding protein [Microbacterium chengjingii]QPZ37336.1 ABC transporter ATP-binding protein [Microbacterium chengjingii]